MKTKQRIADEHEDCVHDCAPCEKAYRRGVHQAYVLLRRYLEHESAKNALDIIAAFEAEARTIRYDTKPHDQLLHEVYHAVKERNA